MQINLLNEYLMNNLKMLNTWLKEALVRFIRQNEKWEISITETTRIINE